MAYGPTHTVFIENVEVERGIGTAWVWIIMIRHKNNNNNVTILYKTNAVKPIGSTGYSVHNELVSTAVLLRYRIISFLPWIG